MCHKSFKENDKGTSIIASNVKTMFLERKTSTKAITWRNECSVVQTGGSYTRIESMSTAFPKPA